MKEAENSPLSWSEFYSEALSTGILPRDFWDMTFSEFAAYSQSHEFKEKITWQHTATVCSLLVNINKSKGKKPTRPEDFYPFDVEKAPKNQLTKVDISQMAEAIQSTLSNVKK